MDANARTGYERLARATTLAAAIQRRRRPVYFMSQLEPNALAINIKRAGNNWIAAKHPAGSAEDAHQLLREIRRLEPAAVFIDEADVSQDYLAAISATGVLSAAIDQSANIRFPTKLLINPLLGPNREGFEYDEEAQLLLGKRYALVRPEIRRQQPDAFARTAPPRGPKRRHHRQPIPGAARAGEDDPNLMTIDLAKLLVNAPRVGKVDIIVRREHPQLEEIRRWSKHTRS